MARRSITVGSIQTSYGPDIDTNIAKTEAFVLELRSAAPKSFCRPSCSKASILHAPRPKVVRDARPVRNILPSSRFVTREVFGRRHPISFFEKDGPRYYNSIAIADADGEILGVYRKSHIPDGQATRKSIIFVRRYRLQGMEHQARQDRRRHLLDQWYPESARAMVLQGAEVLFYPTAIGPSPTTQASIRTCNGSARCKATPYRMRCDRRCQPYRPRR